MDPNKHPELIGNNEEKYGEMYFSRKIDNAGPHTQYFLQESSDRNKKSCECTSASLSGTLFCNSCRSSSVERNWISQQKEICRNVDTINTLRRSPIYSTVSSQMQSTPSISYWQHHNSFYADKSMASNKLITIDRNVSNKYKHFRQPQQNPNAIGNYCAERSYENNCLSRSDSVDEKNSFLSATSPTITINNAETQNITYDIINMANADQHIVNPSNILFSKVSLPSPNYVRKCPQIFSTDEQNSLHHNLYMSTPQFSSDKFNNINSQQMSPESPQPEYRIIRNSNSNIHLISETGKLYNSSVQLQLPSTISSYSHQKKYHQMNETTQSHVLSQQSPCSSSNIQSKNVNFFHQGSSNVEVAEMSPIVLQQIHHHYQYSKSPIPPSAPHRITAKSSTREIVEFMKKESHPHNDHEIHSRSLYTNPYNTPPSSDSCCKESSSHISTLNYKSEPQDVYHKYGKVVQETVTTTKIGILNQNTPPTNKHSDFRSQTYYYGSQNLKDDSNFFSEHSASAATVAPATSLLTSQNLIQHNDYPLQSHHSQPYHQNQVENRRSTIKNLEIRAQQGDLQVKQVQPLNSKMTCINLDKVPTLNFQTSLPPQTFQTKKTHVTKPNYRELINQVYAIRNATSEEELNLQIIKKTLNVDAQELRSAVTPICNVITAPPLTEKQPTVLNVTGIPHLDVTSVQRNYIRDPYITKTMSTVPPHTLPKSSLELQDLSRNIKQEDKSNGSPLDLSIRTIKTKADSTEYKYRRYAMTSLSADSKYIIPKVDFNPNFSLHTANQYMITKPITDSKQEQICETKIETAPHLSDIPSKNLANQSINQSQFFIKQNLLDASMNSVNLLTYESSEINKVQHQPFNTIVEPQIHSNSLIKKTAGNQSLYNFLETNQNSAKAISPESKISDKKFVVVEQFSSDTSIMHLPKISLECQAHIGEIGRFDTLPQSSHSAYSQACERNPNFLGRKRHLQEYNNSKYSEPVIKQLRFQEAPLKSEYKHATDITVITMNKSAAEIECIRTASKAIQAEIPCLKKNGRLIIGDNDVIRTVKNEPVTHSTEFLPSTIAPIKTETNSLIAARIRTKAELKGFTFSPPFMEEATLKKIPEIKKESVNIGNLELAVSLDQIENDNQRKVSDFRWSNICNNFVEQLIIGTSWKKTFFKKKTLNLVNSELSEDENPVPTPVLKADNIVISGYTQENNDELITNYHSRDEHVTNIESFATNIHIENSIANDSQITIKSRLDNTVGSQSVIQKKVGKFDREKMRLQQEKRIAARLQRESSSETDNEFDKRKSGRFKKLLKKGRIRYINFPEENRFSDCGSDSSSDSDSNGTSLKSITEQNEQTEEIHSSSKQFEEDIQHIFTNCCEKNKADLNNECLRSVETKINVMTKDGKNEIDENRICLKNEPVVLVKERLKNLNKKVQYEDELNNKSKSEKLEIKERLYSRVDLNTMTRSKRKRELELQLANSKVLRNEKIIRNSMTKIKRKYVRKYAINKKAMCNESLMREASVIMSTRLRSKTEKKPNIINKNNANKKKIIKSVKHKNEKKNAAISSNKKAKEKQVDLLMEVYRYKRSLKVPPSLITIKHPNNHKITSSLPDLERDIDERSAFSKYMSKTDKLITPFDKSEPDCFKSEIKSHMDSQNFPEEPRSIIDLLHSRVINSATRFKSKAKAIINSAPVNVQHGISQNTEASTVNELLPDFKLDDNKETNLRKKRHFSIFETKVLQTKTRTESKLQKKREIIREIFVGDDRPASAPPEMIQSLEGSEKMTYEQKYEQFLQQMNVVISEDKLRNLSRAATTVSSLDRTIAQVSLIKPEEVTESTLENYEKHVYENQRNNLSNMSSTLTNFKRRRTGKYLRRKGSSGFDYIRKKKKSIIASGAASHSHKLIKPDENNELKIKAESDVCREIQKWVLNKGVGQSTMHKAARQGYIDVIVYCLERMGMNPDQKDNAGYTPLHEACTNGWLQIARVLLQFGANHSEAAHSGIRPLHEASENDHEELVRLLLSYGADPLLVTYSGQTPLMLASSTGMRDILNNHLSDVQNNGPDRKPLIFNGPWEIFDEAENGYDIFTGAPSFTCDMSRALRKTSVSSLITNRQDFNQYEESNSTNTMDKCAVVLGNIDRFNSVRLYNDKNPEFLVENSDSEGEIFEFEEADVLLPPLYLLKDEGTDKWVLLSDLCNLLKVKSKDTILNKIYPSSSIASTHKSLMRELKMSDFLEKATCLQLLCVGEKINICTSKVVLIKYNDNVRNLLGVKTILMKF